MIALNRGEGPVPVEVLRYWRSKGIRPGFDYRDVWEQEHDTAFTAAKIMRTDVLAALRTSLDRAVEEGTPYDRWRVGIGAELERLGFWGTQRVTDPDSGEEVEIDVPRRLRTIFETNTRTARAAGQWERIERTKRTSPYLLYMVGPSLVHREEHLAWHGVCLHADDPWWVTHFPPNGYGCKCHIRQITERERDRLVRDGIPAAERTRLENGELGGERTTLRLEAPEIVMRPWLNKRTGETMMVPEGITPGFAHRPTQRLREPPPRGTPPAPAAPPPVPTPSATPPATPTRDRAAGQVELHETHADAMADMARVVRLPEATRARAIREASRRLYQTLEPTARSYDVLESRPYTDMLDVVDDIPGRKPVRAYHTENGRVVYHRRVFADAQAGFAAVGTSKRPTYDQVQAMRTVVHETGHEHTPASVDAWATPVGVRIEEVTTEALARDIMRRLGLYTDAQVVTTGSYQELHIEPFLRAMRAHVPNASRWTDAEAMEHVIVSARRLRARAESLPDEDSYVRAMAEALGVPTDDITAFHGALR